MDRIGLLAHTGDGMAPLAIAVIIIAVVAVVACVVAFVLMRRKR